MRPPHSLSITSSTNRYHTTGPFILLVLLGACDDAATRSTAMTGESDNQPRAVSAADSSFLARADLTTTSLTLPFSGAVVSSSAAFHVKQYGTGQAGLFEKVVSGGAALHAVNQVSGEAVRAISNGTGGAAVFSTSNASNTNPTIGVYNLGTAQVALFNQFHMTTTRPAVEINNYSPGDGLVVDHRNTTCTTTQASCNLAVFQASGVNKIRFGRGGKGYFALGTVTGGADLAEAFEVEGEVGDVEPGDVLVISLTSDRKVERSYEAYSTLLAGVYATRPGVLLTERDIDDPMTDMVPLGVIGVIPTKVSAVNGPIRRGDLLVTSGEPGYAMRGTDHRRMSGAILGRALQEFKGPGRGMIQVLVSVR